MGKVKHVRMKVEWMNSSRQQYKPYSYNLVPENLTVEIPLEEVHIIENTKDGMVIDLSGFSMLLSTIADSLDAMHDVHEEEQRARFRVGATPKTKVN